jgi:hypothetical protein
MVIHKTETTQSAKAITANQNTKPQIYENKFNTHKHSRRLFSQ